MPPSCQPSQLVAADGVRLFIADWASPEAGRRGGIVLMHGLGEHCGRYAHVAEFLTSQGWMVRGYDHRGHGRSGGRRGDVPDTETLARDAVMVIEDFGRRIGSAPFLLGHSMGGLFAAQVATANLVPLRGLILSSPALAVRLSAAQQLLHKLLAAAVPGLGINNGLQANYLSHDASVVQAYENDRLVHARISARLLNAMLGAMSFTHSHAASLAIPVLLLVAGNDHLVDASGSDRFFASLPAHMASRHRYDGYYHELFNETGVAQVFDDLRRWLDAHAAPGHEEHMSGQASTFPAPAAIAATIPPSA